MLHRTRGRTLAPGVGIVQQRPRTWCWVFCSGGLVAVGPDSGGESAPRVLSEDRLWERLAR